MSPKFKKVCHCLKLKSKKKTTKKKNVNKNKNKININVSSSGSSAVPYQAQYKPQNQEMFKFSPTNHTLNVNHSFTPTDKPFNINSLLGNAEDEFNLNTDLRELRKGKQSAEPTFDDIYTNPFFKPVQPQGLESLTKDVQPMSTTTENISTFNKKVEPEGLAGIISPEEKLYNKQKSLLDFYAIKEIPAENVKKVGRGRPLKSMIRLDPVPENDPPKPRGRPPKNPKT